MNTKQVLNLILQKFDFTKYQLAKRLGVPYTTMARYLDGKNEANFLDLMSWLKNLHLSINGDKLYFDKIKSHSLNEMEESTAQALLLSSDDNDVWNEEGKCIEEKEGHHIEWLDKPW